MAAVGRERFVFVLPSPSFSIVVVALFFIVFFFFNFFFSSSVVVVAKYCARSKVKREEREANFRGTCLGFQMYEKQRSEELMMMMICD